MPILIDEGLKNYGYDALLQGSPLIRFWICIECQTIYPVLNGRVMCNGHKITKCPWCRPDSKAWKYGRGI